MAGEALVAGALPKQLIPVCFSDGGNLLPIRLFVGGWRKGATAGRLAHCNDQILEPAGGQIELDQDLLNLVCEQASLEFMLAHKSKFSEILQQAVAAKDNLWPPSETTSNIRNGLMVGHGAELPPEIGAEIDAIWRETVEPRTGLASYDALLAALA